MRRGTRVGSGHVNITADGSNLNEEIIDAVDDATDHAGDAGEEAGDRYGRRFSDRFRERMEGFRGRVAGRLNERLGREGREAGENAGDQAGEGFVERVGRKAREAGDRAAQEMGDRFSSKPEKIRHGIERAFSDEFVDRIATRFADRMSEKIGERMRVVLDEQRRLIEEDGGVSRNRRRAGAGDGDSDIGARIGRLFGAGSRNNFLNIIGRSIGGIVSLSAKAGKGAFDMFKVFKEGFNSLEEGSSVLKRFGAGIDGVLGKIGPAIPGAVAGILAVAAAASILASVLSALAAIVTALLATITSALVGGLTVLGGAFLAVATSVGLLVAAFTSLTDAQKKAMGETFAPLKDMLIGIGQVVLRDLVPAFETWAVNLRGALNLIVPLANVMGQAFGAAGSILTKALSGPGFQNFFAAMTEFLPKIVTNLSSALGGFLNGLLGLFSAVTPFVLQFANYLDRVATRFSNWANSAQGQNAIVDFTKRALDSLKSLWNFTREFFGFLGDLLFSPQAQKAGNSMFDSLAKSFRGFRDAIKRAQADGSLEKWFESAADFAGDLKVLLIGLKDVFKTLVSNQTLKTFGDFVRILGKMLTILTDIEDAAEGAKKGVKNFLGPLGGVVDIITSATNPLKRLTSSMDLFGDALNLVRGDTDDLGGAIRNMANNALADLNLLQAGAFSVASNLFSNIQGAVSGIVSSVSNSIAGASAQVLGSQSPQSKGPKQYKNPYVAYANSLIKDGPTIVQQIRNAIKSINNSIATALLQNSKSKDGAAVRDSLLSIYQQTREQGAALVDAAQQAVNSAAQRLASASSAAEARRALAAVRRAQAGLKRALAEQKNLNRVATLLAQQRTVRTDNVTKLLEGLKVQNATLAEYATARARLATQIEQATTKLANAIALRDDFKKQITDSIISFGSLVSATAKTVNGVAQALTAEDVIGNLEDRLAKIRQFQENLRILLAQGLSDAAYKQLLEAGVDGGAATAAALVAGGQGAVDAVNSLLGQIGDEAKGLGTAASDRMYQAGVDMAQGLLDGLKSLDAQLASAAAKLGESIASAIKHVLGIKSPSRVAMDLMGYWGDGMELGLDEQSSKVGSAAARLASRVAVSPEVATYASRREGAVSGNEKGRLFRDFIVQTPTENPRAVAVEAINELTARL